MPKHRVVAAAAMSAIALVGACSSPQHASKVTGTTPAIWTGASAPSPTSGTDGAEQQPAGQSLTTQLKTPDGIQVATAKFDFSNGYATITIATSGAGHLTPGFHGVHIHKVGKCEANSTAPAGGAPGDFLSAGGHFQAPGHSGMPESGDLTMLEVRQDGSAYLVTTSDAFTRDQLLAGEKTALMIHGAQNTESAMDRIACGVIGTS